jgi:hypothetical protein
MPARKGFLMVTMEPPAGLEEEFNDWYDTEHVPERQAVPGFQTATRYVCLGGWPRYLALYDLAAPEVIDGPGYRAISGERFSPWTKRILLRMRGFYRLFGEQVYPAESLVAPAARTLFLFARDAADVPDSDWISRARAAFDSRADMRQLRVFRSAAALGGDVMMQVGLDAHSGPVPLDLAAFGPLARRIDRVNEYATYFAK